MSNRVGLELSGVFPCCVVHMQDDIRHSVVIELAQTPIRHEFDLPCTDCAAALERQVAFVAKTQFEHTVIVLGIAGRDGIHADMAFAKAWIICKDTVVIVVFVLRNARRHRPHHAFDQA